MIKEILILLILSATQGFSVCEISDVLPSIRPKAEWSLSGDTYAGLNWIDRVQTKPALPEIQTAQTSCLDALKPAGILAKQRADAVGELNTGTQPLTKLQRAVFLVTLDEFNVLRQRDRDRSADVAAAASLADLKTRWAARAALADRTMTQFRNAVQGKIESGAAD